MANSKILWTLAVLVLVGASAAAGAGLVNINTAGSDELQTLVGIGPSLAAKIIAYREANGPFLAISDIMKVSGIKEGIFAGIKDFITVGSGAEGQPASEESNLSPSSGSDEIQTHSLAVPVKRGAIKEDLAVSAGRPRLAVVHAPLEFRALVSKGGPAGKTSYFWSFGDGVGVRGERASHTYQFPGQYVVVVKAKQGELEAVGRTTVEIVAPRLKVERGTAAPDSVTIANQGKTEVNLGGWLLKSGDARLVLPSDTIIDAGRQITLLVDQAAEAIELVCPDGTEFLALPSAVVLAEIRSLEAELAQAKAKLGALLAAGSPEVVPRTPELSLAAVPALAVFASPTVVQFAKPPGVWQRIITLFKK